ncbi:MAG: T9SS type A sorting domain-containing protein [Candidatus Krumholzibacteriota bacterium]|nr:T9SS type A sorting domain-containing protein [Candidatus Krumholzibacteriota bacterium]
MKSVVFTALLIVLFIAVPASAQQQFIDYSQVSLLRWMGTEKPDTYSQYLAAHPPQPLKIVPLRMAPPRSPLDENPPRVLVIVNSTLLPLIQTKLDRYISDIEAEGYAADLYSSTLGTAEDLKAFILSESTDLAGCVLFGDLPCAWYEIEDDFEEYGYASFPCDLYLTDLDGSWLDSETVSPMQSGVYDTHADGSGDTAPEIFVGRIDASQMSGDSQDIQINGYLDKLHAWYSLELPVTNYALTYTEDDWSSFSDFENDIGYAFPDREAIKAPDTNRDDYCDIRLTSSVYQFIQLSCHSNPSAHYFSRGGQLYNTEIRAIPPKAHFYNLFCCSASRYTYSDFLGGAYIFNPSTTALATVGSTKTGSMLNFWAFYQPLGEGKTVGQALSDWFNTIAPYSFDEICWHYGMVITGDPLIVPVSGFLSSIVLHQPNGGEVLSVGEEYEIQWWTSAIPDSICILLSVDGGDTYSHTVASGLPGTDESFVWTVSDFPVSLSRIRVEAWYGGEVVGYDFSESDFFIQGGPYRYVSKTGGNIFPYSAPSWAALSIEDAVDAADPGDSIMVETGTYYEKVTLVKPVHIMGGWNVGFTLRDTRAYPSTISSSGSVVSFISIPAGTPGIEGCHIINGIGTAAILPVSGIYGGGVISYGSDAMIRGNVITGCGYTTSSGFSGGGAIACYDGTVTILDNEIVDCDAQSGGGIYLYQASATIEGNTITGCQPDPGYSGTKNGGGIYALHAPMDLSGNSIHDNNGYMDGGGIYARLSPVVSSEDSIYSNGVSGKGGGILSDHSSVSLSSCFVGQNDAVSYGGGIYLKGEQFDINNTIVTMNHSSGLGGGIFADSSWGDWTNNTIDRNTADVAVGNVFTMNAVSMDIRNNMITYGSPNGFQPSMGANITFQYNDCYGNTPEDVTGIIPDSTNISRHPHYSDTALVDYQLALHSGGIDTGDPSISDIDGSTSDIGAFGGPGSSSLAPEYVHNLAASAINDTTIEITWDEPLPGELDYYAIYADSFENFIPDASNFLTTLPASVFSYLDSALDSCMYYRVNVIGLNGYAGGYSNVDGDCISGTTTGADEIPSYVNMLGQNYPNPFNGSTTITYSISSPARVVLKIYDTAGRLIRTLEDRERGTGQYRILWNGRDNDARPVASGVYFMRVAAGDFKQTKKIVYLR